MNKFSTAMRRMTVLLGLGLCATGALAWPEPTPGWVNPNAEFMEDKPWEEVAVELPAFPQDQNLYSFYVSPVVTSRFFVDVQTLSVGSDGVVRYVLMVISPSGVRNVTFEGMRCATKERRIYASGRPDGSWSKSRAEQWTRVREVSNNRHHAALYTDFFCPDGVMNYRVGEIQHALRKAGRPLSEQP